MKEIFVLAFIWHFCSLALVVHSVNPSDFGYFKVTEDRNTVNEEVLAYIEHKKRKTWTSIVEGTRMGHPVPLVPSEKVKTRFKSRLVHAHNFVYTHGRSWQVICTFNIGNGGLLPLYLGSVNNYPNIQTSREIRKGARAVRKERNILNRNRDEIIQLCKDAVPADFYGLELVTTFYGEPQVTKNVLFSLEHTQVDGDQSFKLDMVACPRMTYTDLETNEERLFQYVYQLSKARNRHSAFLFRQILHSGLTYPARLIADIDFSALQRRAGSTVHPFVHELMTDTRESRIQTVVNAHQTIRHLNEIYEKFLLLYNSFAICRLRRRYIIYTCRQILESENPEIELDINNYHEHSCRKRPMHFEYISKDKSSEYKELYFVRCPQTTSPFNSDDKSKPITFRYLASNIAYRSVVVFSRLNRRGEKLRPLELVEDLEVRKMKKDKRRERIEPYQQDKWRQNQSELLHFLSKKLITENINSSHDGSTIKMPATLARQGEYEVESSEQLWTKSVRFTDDRSQVEDFLTEFSRIKTNKLVYERFKQTHFSIDFCQLSKLEKKYLCDEALSDYAYRLEPNSADPSSFDRPCFRQPIMLTFGEVNDLPTDEFSMWECPASKNHPKRVYFMGKSHFRDAVFLYRALNYKRKSDEPLTFVHPDMLIYKVNRNKLAQLRVSVGLDQEQGQQFRVTSDISTDLEYGR